MSTPQAPHQPVLAVERWLSAPGFEGFYEVSDQGRVRRSVGGKSTKAGNVLTPHPKTGGLLQVILSVHGQCSWRQIHRLVATAFIRAPGPSEEVNHKDGNHENNHVENLEWLTPIENKRHALRTGLIATIDLSQDDLDAIKADRDSYIRIGAKFGISKSLVGNIKNGLRREVPV